jgi:hypothetical protein
MSNKTISINPSLFSMGGSKTKKNREKKPAAVVPLISPNVLKNKLLKRIKEHKLRETENLDLNKKNLPTHDLSIKNDIVKQQVSSFSDEFSDSINYLQTLSKQKKVNDEKDNYERQKIIRKEQLERKTIRNHNPIIQSHIEHNVNLDLPEELMTSPLIVVNTDTMNSGGNPIQLHTRTDSIPYGILKGGTKPTYRDWAKTQRNYDVTNPQAALTIQGNELNKKKNERENRLNSLREKLKQKQIEETINKSENMTQQNQIQKPILELEQRNENVTSYQLQNQLQNNIPVIGGEKIIGIKKITKKITKRKYTLGKSKVKKTVSILIKDRGTRKIILGAQKDLKRKPLNDVKDYLRDHNLIKIGSNAPNDVLRKLYESAMLAGEITNSNSEILLHNFSKDDKEL